MSHDLGALGNRLRKVAVKKSLWAKKEGISAYRLYDLDIPELKYMIDRYNNHVVVYDLNAQSDADTLLGPFSPLIDIIAKSLDLPAKHIHVKIRRRIKNRRDQYTKIKNDQSITEIVSEGPCRYKVNLTDYLDTGLFLDHRPLRKMLSSAHTGHPQRRVLNLFCYTGSLSVAAAKGGAGHVTSVDLSPKYLEWAKENVAINGMDPNRSEAFDWIEADTSMFLGEAERKKMFYDTIIIDPPTFSNSKRCQRPLMFNEIMAH